MNKNITLPAYDFWEAADLLSDYLEKVSPDTKGRADACRRLMASLQSLSEQMGLKARPGPDALEVEFAKIGVVRVAEDQGDLFVSTLTGPKTRAPLRYNRSQRVLEGEQEDPGAQKSTPRKRRSGLAVLTETMIQVLEQK